MLGQYRRPVLGRFGPVTESGPFKRPYHSARRLHRVWLFYVQHQFEMTGNSTSTNGPTPMEQINPAAMAAIVTLVTPAPAYTAPPVASGYHNYAPGYWGATGAGVPAMDGVEDTLRQIR